MSRELRGHGSIYKQSRLVNGVRVQGGFWWIAYNVRGKQYRESSESPERSAAARLLKKRIGESANGKPMIAPKAERVTLGAMLAALKDDYARKGNRSGFAASARHLLDFFGENAKAIDIRRDTIMGYVAARREMLIRRSGILQPPSNGTLNFELALLRRAFQVQVESANLSRDHAPVMPMLEKPKARQGFLDPVQFEALCAKLPADLHDPVRFLYLSGWRRGEMATIEWRDIDRPSGMIRLRAERSKNKRARQLPLSGDLSAIIERAAERRRLDCPFVFHRDGSPLGSFRKAWASACTAAGLAGLLVHDLRRSCVRNLVRAGVPESAAMSFTGHLTRSIFDRYDVIDKKDLEAAAEKMAAYIRERAQEKPKVEPLRKTA